MRRPYYYSADSLYLLMSAGPMFYLRLSDGRIFDLLITMQKIGKENEQFLDKYPKVLYESLELFYRCRKGMCSLDNELIQDLLFSFSWREANWGAWLVALAPNPVYIPYLKNRVKTLSHGKEVVELALASCGEPVRKEIEKHYLLLKEVRSMLEGISITKFPMRKWFTIDQELTFKLEVEALKKVYHDGGISMANVQLKKGMLGYYLMSHSQWLKMGAPNTPNNSLQADGFTAA